MLSIVDSSGSTINVIVIVAYVAHKLEYQVFFISLCVSGGKDEEEDDDSDTDDVAEADEDVDESDLDLAWKMLDVARAIAEKQQSGDTMEKVDILSALAEVALERGQYLTTHYG